MDEASVEEDGDCVALARINGQMQPSISPMAGSGSLL